MSTPHDFSRHLFCHAIRDAKGRLHLSDRVPYRYVERSDNRFHIVGEGDTLFWLAHKYFDGVTDRPDQFFWCIADFQPVPIIDATLALKKGTTIVIPSVRCLVEEIFNEKRRPEFEGVPPAEVGATSKPAPRPIRVNGVIVGTTDGSPIEDLPAHD